MRRRRSSVNDPRILIANSLVDIDPDYAVSASDLPNRGTGGTGYDLDVNVGTAANRKIHPSGSCLLFGANGDYASTPDSAAASITGDIDIRLDMAVDDWTPASTQYPLSKLITSGQYSYDIELRTNGVINFRWSANGTTVNNATSTAAPSFSDGERGRIRITMDVDNGSGGYDVTFYTSTDGVAWSQLGSVITGGATTSIHDGSDTLSIGAQPNGGQPISGKVYRAQIYNGIDGTLAVDFDPTNYVSGTTFSSGGVTWTLNGNSFIQNTGHDVLHSIGSNGLETAAGQTMASPGTVFLVAKYTSPPASGQVNILSSRSSAPNRWELIVLNGKFAIFQGSSIISLTEDDDEDPHVFTGQFNGDATTKLTVSGVGSATGNAGSGDFDYGSLLMSKDGDKFVSGYVARLLVFDYALSETQVSAIQNYLSAYYGGI